MITNRATQFIKKFLLSIAILFLNVSFAAKPIQLHHQSGIFLQNTLCANSLSELQEVASEKDLNNIMHKRFKQKFAGVTVWGADVVAHYPNHNQVNYNKIPLTATVDGLIYQNIESDLKNSEVQALKPAQATLMLQHAIDFFHHQAASNEVIEQPKIKKIIFVDQVNKAHWAFLISFWVERGVNKLPAKPVIIIDANNFTIYQHWDDIHTLETILAGGLGGNYKKGKITYDGLFGNSASLNLQRDEAVKMCYFSNNHVMVSHIDKPTVAISFQCILPSAEHNNLYWNGSLDATNGAYSPSNDALFSGKAVSDMYQHWYGIPALIKEGKPMLLHMNVHKKIENAYWDGKQMTFGDGGNTFYPLVSIGIAAHEISHGFTYQHAHLINGGQSGGLNEAFSDMAAQAVEFYLTGTNNWQIGAEVMKEKNRALRYMNEPTQDCADGTPGKWCSISQLADYYEGIDVHHSAGIFNKAFYLLASTPGWDTHKAFDVMVQANRFYWLPQTNFIQAACGVLRAAQDYHYELEAVKKAFRLVGISLVTC